jgi:hypothetical protein
MFSHIRHRVILHTAIDRCSLNGIRGVARPSLASSRKGNLRLKVTSDLDDESVELLVMKPVTGFVEFDEA